MKFFKLIALLLISIGLITCAQPKGLQGGPKDVAPPKVLKLSPQNLSTNFNGSTIAMEFDEYVQIKSLNSELIVSPPLKYPVTYRLKGKRVFFDLQDTLKPNTTYNFNFGNAIVDLNENNPLDSNLFVFSTGSNIDSGYIYGAVKDAYTQAPVKGASVVLYHHTTDSALFAGEPLYVAKTDAKGEYELRFLNATQYQIFVLETPGENFRYIPQTKMGFHKDLVEPGSDTPINFLAFSETDTSQFITKSFSKEYFSFNIGFNTDLNQPKFTFSPAKEQMHYVTEQIRADSFKFWIPNDQELDSVTVNISDKNGFSEEVEIDLAERKMFYKKLKRKKETHSPVRVSLGSKNGVHHYFDTLRLNFSRPLQQWDVDSMYFAINADTLPMRQAIQTGVIDVKLPQNKYGTSKQLRSVEVTHKWEPSTEYSFIFNSGSFKDIINETNDTTYLRFKTKNFEDYGSFRFTVNVPGYSQNLVLQLLDTKGKLLRNYYLKSGGEIYHELAVPGKYKFRLILDKNGNGKWDSGDYVSKRQPEEVINYSGTIDIRANWDMEETWEVELK